jgi:hypothetical protein
MSFTEFFTTIGFRVHILPIQVSLDKTADLCAMIFNPSGLHKFSYRLLGDEYTNWGSNDNYIKELVCDKESWIGRPVYNDSDIIPSVPVTTASDDTRSVHNEADIQKIQTLQEQLDAQAAKLKTITDMLIGKGLV